jgi:hypothetical protein
LLVSLIYVLRDTHFKREIDIHVFAWKRSKSLSRLLYSLNDADYSSSSGKVMMIVHVDGDSTEDVNRVLLNFKWKFGRKYYKIQKSKKNQGLKEILLKSWDYSKYSLFLEDDVQVSRFYFSFLQKCLKFIKGSDILGCSLYTPRLDEITPGIKDLQNPPLWNFRNLTKREYVYYQLPCSWGAVYEEVKFKSFLKYLKFRAQNTTDLQLSLRSNNWAQSWKRFLIEFMYAKGYFLLYPNYENQVSYSTNYYEEGVHSVPEGFAVVVPDTFRQVPDYRFQVPLVTDFDLLQTFPTLQEEIPWISIHNRIVNESDAVMQGQEWITIVQKIDPRAAEMLRN